MTTRATDWLRRDWPVLALAAGIFWLSLRGGAYALTVRNPAAIALLVLVGVAVAAGLWPRGRLPRAALLAGGLLAAFTLVNGLSATWADSAEKAFTEFNRVGLFLTVFAIAVLGARLGGARQWSHGLAVGITAVGLLALASRLFIEEFGPSEVAQVDPSDPRLSHPLNYWNGLAIFVGLGFPLLLAAATTARSTLWSLFSVAPFPALAGTIYLTSSRGGVAAGVIALLAFVAFTNRRQAAVAALVPALVGSAAAIAVLHAQKELVDGPLDANVVAGQGRTSAALIVLFCALTVAAYAWCRRVPPLDIRLGTQAKRGLVAAGVVVLLAAVVAADPAQRFDDLKRPPESFEGSYTRSHLLSSGGSGRWQFWEAAVDQFEGHPVLGDGAGSYEAWWAQHGELVYFTRNAHSLLVETLGELGLVGILLLLGLAAIGVVVGIGRVRGSPDEERPIVAALLAVYLAFLFAAATDWIWDLTVVGVLGIVCLGLLTGPATLFGAGTEARPRLGLGWRIGIPAVAAALLVAQVIPLAVELKVRDSQDELKDGDEDAALASAEDARGYQGWAASPHLQVALVYETRGDLADAREEIGEAIDNDPSDWRLWAVSSRIEEAAGDLDAARDDYEQAKKLNPRSPLFTGSG